MRGITKVVKTDYYWDTLEEFRTTPYYEQLLSGIATCVANKVNDRNHQGNKDTPFSAEKALKGIWHCRLTQSPLKLLFYSIEGDTINLLKIGNHDDYGYSGKRVNGAAERLADNVRKALARGHVAFADWKTFRWSDPARIAVHPELPMMSSKSLRRLDAELRDEFDTMAMLSRKHGGQVADVPVEEAIAWLSSIEAARERLRGVIESRHVHERIYKVATDARYAMSEPPAAEPEGYTMRM